LGSDGLDHSVLKERLQRVEVLEKENMKLKELLAEEKLESALKNDLLKKKYPHLRKLLQPASTTARAPSETERLSFWA